MANVQINLTVKDDGSVVLGKVGDKLDDVGKKAKQAQSGMDDFAKSLLSGVGIGAGFKVAEVAADALLSVVKGIPATFAAWTAEALKAADNLSNLSASTGLSTDALQKFERMGAPMGVAMETIARSAIKMQQRMSQVPKAFEEIGLSVEHLKALEPDQAFEEVVNAIGKLPSRSEQAAASMKLLGDKSSEMLRVIREGIKPVEDFGEMTSAQVENLDNLGDATGEAEQAWKNLTIQLAATVAQSPEILAFVKDLAAGVGGAAAAVRDNGQFITDWLSATVLIAEKGIPVLDQFHRVLQLMASDPQIKTNVWDPAKIAPPSMDAEFEKLVANAQRFGEEAQKAQDKAEAAARKHLKALEDLERAELAVTRSSMDGAEREIAAWAKTEEKIREQEAAALAASEASEVAAQREAFGLESLYNVVDRGTGLWTRYGDVVEQEMENAAASTEREIGTLERLGETMNAITSIVDAVAGALDMMGISADSAIGKAVSGFQDLAQAGQHAVASVSAFASGNILGGIIEGFKTLGPLVSGVKKIWDGLFGNKTIMKVNDLRDAFLESQGGWLHLQQQLAQVSTEDIVKQIFDAKTVDEFNAAVQRAKDALAGLNNTLPPVPHVPGDDGQTDAGRPAPDDMPQYAMGTMAVPFTGPKIVHRNETIIPTSGAGLDKMAAKVAAMVADGGSSGPTVVHLQVDGRTLATQVINPMMRNNTGGARTQAQGGIRSGRP